MRGQTRGSPRAAEKPTEDILLEAATAVFAEAGFSGARVDEIARRARINKAMIYYHFGSKRKLYQLVVVRLFSVVTGEIERLRRDEPEPRRRLSAFYAALARLFAEQPALPRLMMREVLAGGRHLDAETARSFSAVLDFVASAVSEGVRRGVFRSVNPLVVHLSLIGPLILFSITQPMRARLMPLAAASLTPPELSDVVAHLNRMLAAGLEPDPGEAGRGEKERP